jgi:cell wall-associated NlpC family hydrolase
VRTTGKHRRTTTSTTKRQRALMTASLASIGVIGSAFMATPANAAESTPALSTTPSLSTLMSPVPYGLADSLVNPVVAPLDAAPAPAPTTPTAPAALPPATPVVRLAANASSVTVGQAIGFTASEHASGGAPVPGGHATLQVTTKHGWQNVVTHLLDSTGSTTFSFHPNFNHSYRALFTAATEADGSSYTAATTANVFVKAKPKDIGPLIVAAAAKEKGHPYVFGAAGPKYFDCSGLVKYVYAQFGINLPHHANDMKHYGKAVSRANAVPGDLVFVFSGSYAHHVAIYAGHDMWWEAPHTGASVRLVKIWSNNIQFRHVR